eukprot:4833736-Alexandrium_andersonii.AAC.1
MDMDGQREPIVDNCSEAEGEPTPTASPAQPAATSKKPGGKRSSKPGQLLDAKPDGKSDGKPGGKVDGKPGLVKAAKGAAATAVEAETPAKRVAAAARLRKQVDRGLN